MKQRLLFRLITALLSLLLLAPEVVALPSGTPFTAVSAIQQQRGGTLTIARATKRQKKTSQKKKGRKKARKRREKTDQNTSGTFLNTAGAQDCGGDIACLVQGSRQCQPAKATLETTEGGGKALPFTIATRIEVQGKTPAGLCPLSYQFERFTGPYDSSLQPLIGTEGTCLIQGLTEQGMLLELETLRKEMEDPRQSLYGGFSMLLFLTNSSNDAHCKGRLFENLRALSGG